MFDWLKRFAAEGELKETDKLPSEEELQMAAVLLMIEMAGIDGDYAPEESNKIIEFIQQEYDLPDADAVKLLLQAYKNAEKKELYDRFFSFIAVGFNDEQKQRLIALLIKITQADGKFVEAERALLKRLKSDLGMSETSFNRARMAAREE